MAKSGMNINLGCSLMAYQVVFSDKAAFYPRMSKDEFINDKMLISCHNDIYVQTIVGKVFNDTSANTRAKFIGAHTGEKKYGKTQKIYYTTLDAFKDAINPDNSRELSEYVNMLFEIYASMPYLLRERLIMHDTVEKIQNIIKNGKKFKPATPYQRVPRRQENDDDRWFIPCMIRTDSLRRYLYVCGMYENGHISSFRIDRLRIREISDDSAAVISAEDRAKIENKIDTLGAEYIMTKGKDIYIIMNARGLTHYYENIRNRPELNFVGPYADDPSFSVYRCFSAPYKIRNYFDDTFCGNAIILEPENFHNAILKKMETALDGYKKYGSEQL